MFKLYHKREDEFFWSPAPQGFDQYFDWADCQTRLLAAMENHRFRMTNADTIRPMVCLVHAETIMKKPWRKGAKRRTFKFITYDNKTTWKYQIRREDDGLQKG